MNNYTMRGFASRLDAELPQRFADFGCGNGCDFDSSFLRLFEFYLHAAALDLLQNIRMGPQAIGNASNA